MPLERGPGASAYRLRIRASDGGRRAVALAPKPVGEFYAETMAALHEPDIHTRIQPHPNEVEPAIPFAEDDRHGSYDPDAAEQFWRQLLQANRVFSQFRAGFVGKVSPVHFFWGAMDLACTRFSGRTAPAHAGGAPNCPDWVMQEGYSHEPASCGFWPGGGEEGAFYAYAYPEPPGYPDASPGGRRPGRLGPRRAGDRPPPLGPPPHVSKPIICWDADHDVAVGRQVSA